MPLLPGRRRRPDSRPIPAHPYRDTALVYAGMGVLLVIVATLTGGQALRAVVAAAIFWALATAWTLVGMAPADPRPRRGRGGRGGSGGEEGAEAGRGQACERERQRQRARAAAVTDD